MMYRPLLACALVATATSFASAGQIAVSSIGGGIMLNSGPVGSNVFGDLPTNWTSSALATVHASINASGVSTDGKVTFLAADTNHGLAMMALIDQEVVPGAPSMGAIHMDSVANGSNLAFINDAAGFVTVTPSGPSSRFATGNFGWNSNGGGDAFAWADLSTGNSITFRFNRVENATLGLNDPSTFQFINWTGTSWAIVAVPDSLLSFSETNDFGFAATVAVPAPSVLILTGGPLLSLSLIRRRSTR